MFVGKIIFWKDCDWSQDFRQRAECWRWADLELQKLNMSTKVDSSNNVEFGTSAQLLPMQCQLTFFYPTTKKRQMKKEAEMFFRKYALIGEDEDL